MNISSLTPQVNPQKCISPISVCTTIHTFLFEPNIEDTWSLSCLTPTSNQQVLSVIPKICLKYSLSLAICYYHTVSKSLLTWATAITSQLISPPSLTFLIVYFLQQQSEGSFKKIYQFMLLLYLFTTFQQLPVALRIKTRFLLEALYDLSSAFFCMLM